MSDDLEAKLRGWVETSGRALELRVARVLRDMGAQVAQAYTYADSTSAKRREGDVLAQFWWDSVDGAKCRLAVALECKSSKGHPWVAFYDDRRPPRQSRVLDDWATYEHGPFTAVTEPLMPIWLGEPPFTLQPVATHLVEGLGKSDVNPANDAVRQVLSAADFLRSGYLENIRDSNSQPAPGIVCLAAVVTEAPLFECYLGDHNELVLRQVSTVQLRINRPGDGRVSRAWIMNESALPMFAAGLNSCAERAGEEARFRDAAS